MSGSGLLVGDARVLMLESGFYAPVAGLFVASELHHLTDLHDVHHYSATVEVLRDRLTAVGFGRQRARDELEASLAAWHAEQPPPLFDEDDWPAATVESVLATMARCIQGDSGFRDPTNEPLERLDPRFQARLLIDQVTEPGLEVRYVLSDLVEHANGKCVDLASQARLEASLHPAGATPTVVLTEGKNDAELLGLGMTVTHPHLVEHVRFMEFDTMKREGGAGALVSLLKGLSAAGLSNRFVAIADNDTAAREALKSAPALPANFRLLRYPPLELLDSYPTRGPQSDGVVPVNVNGLAGSLEMYLGVDVLRETSTGSVAPSDGDRHEPHGASADRGEPGVDEGSAAEGHGVLFPVQWAGYSDRVHAYQGSLSKSHNDLVHDRFKKKVADAKQGNGAADADWTGVRAIIDAIVNAFEPSGAIP